MFNVVALLKYKKKSVAHLLGDKWIAAMVNDYRWAMEVNEPLTHGISLVRVVGAVWLAVAQPGFGDAGVLVVEAVKLADVAQDGLWGGGGMRKRVKQEEAEEREERERRCSMRAMVMTGVDWCFVFSMQDLSREWRQREASEWIRWRDGEKFAVSRFDLISFRLPLPFPKTGESLYPNTHRRWSQTWDDKIKKNCHGIVISDSSSPQRQDVLFRSWRKKKKRGSITKAVSAKFVLISFASFFFLHPLPFILFLLLVPVCCCAFIWRQDQRSSVKAQPTKKSSSLFNITSVCQRLDMFPSGSCQSPGSIILQSDTSLFFLLSFVLLKIWRYSVTRLCFSSALPRWKR